MAATPVEIEEFINGVLVSWLESCLPRPEILSGYDSLLDGSIIHSVYIQIDPEPQNCPNEVKYCTGVALCIARARNFECIVRNLKGLFEEEFGQTILVLPDAFTLGYHPETRQGLEQMKILLTLLLGAAVQCPNKEIFIGRIKELDVDTQHSIVELIKQVTDNHSLVLTEESVDLLTPAAMYNHILRLTKERDNIHMKWISSICTETENNLANCTDNSQSVPHSASGMTISSPSSSNNSESNHMAVELADLKSKLRKLRQELEEKSENYLEVKEELEHKSIQYEKLRNESQEWYSEAKRASAYRDEVDVLRERADRADRLEIEVQKFREKLTDAEFYKTRVEELREDNRMLLETKEMLEDQLQRSRKRSEHVMTLESEIIKYKQKINDMALERDVDRSKLEELLEENTQLQLVTKNISGTQEVDKSFSENEDDCNSGDNSLSEQLTNNAQTRALKLELENRRLTAALDQLKESSFHESTNKILELEKEKKKLSLKLDQMQENISRLSQQNVELEDVFKNALEENKKLQHTIDNLQKSYDRQSQDREIDRCKVIDLEKYVETVNKEKQRIQTLNESIQRRADDTERLLETKTKEIHQFETKITELDSIRNQLYDLENKFTNVERENSSFLKEVAKLKECLEEKAVQLDNAHLDRELKSKEVKRLIKDLDDAILLQSKVIEIEKQNQDLISQHDIDLQTIATLQKDLVSGTLTTNKVKQNLEKLGIDNAEMENSDLNVEHVVEKLVSNPETFKTVREIMLNVTKQQNTKSAMCVLCHRKEIFTVEKNIEISGNIPEYSIEHQIHLSPSQEMPELARLSETNTQLNAFNSTLQAANETLQTENARLNVDVATLGSQITSLNTQHVALQLANSQLAADKDALLKQIESLKYDQQNLLHDQTKLQCLHDQLSSEYETLNMEKEQLKVTVRDLRNEIREKKEQITNLEIQLDQVNKQNGTLKTSVHDLAILRTEHSKLTEDFRNLFATNDRFKNEYKNIQEQYKMIRDEKGRLNIQKMELSSELSAKNEQLKTLEIEYTKAVQRCEMLLQINSDLDSDRKTLMENVSQLLSQYHELLTHSLDDKQHFHEEEKSYSEKVHNLCRQKEKLEEKIMEHYKKSESTVPKKKPFASNLVRRVKKASSDFMNKVPSRNRRSWVEDTRLTQSQFTIGSESGGNDSDNSTEEPNSIASDTLLLQRNIPMRQSLQRKSSELMDNSITRGGVVRSSLQLQKRIDLSSSRRNSVHGLEPPDVTGSSLTLGNAGSRRTVYLIEENQKIPENGCIIQSSPSTSPSVGNLTHSSSTATVTVDPQTPTNAAPAATTAATGVQNTNGKNDVPATFLMYNRINTTIGGNVDSLSTSNDLNSSGVGGGGGASASSNQSMSDDKLNSSRKKPEDKSNSIWYEYGCV